MDRNWCCQSWRIIFNHLLVGSGSSRDKARDGLLKVQLQRRLQPTNPPKPRSEVREAVHGIVADHFTPKAPKTMEQSRLVGSKATQAAYQRMLAEPKVFQQVQRVGGAATVGSPPFMYTVPNQGLIELGPGRWERAPRVEFCIPRNPLIAMLRMRFEVSWFKLNNCMNLAGQHREATAYAAPTDTDSGLPVADIGSPVALAMAARFMPTQYRYRMLIERARQLVAMAQQMEATYLSFLENRDREAYTILQARQALGIAGANVALQDLRLDEAEHQQGLADLQQDRVQFMTDYYDKLLCEDLLLTELIALSSLSAAAFLSRVLSRLYWLQVLES